MEKLTKEDYNNLMIFLNRVEIKGSESLVHVNIMQKISLLIQKEVDEQAQDKVG